MKQFISLNEEELNELRRKTWKRKKVENKKMGKYRKKKKKDENKE